MYLEIGFFCKRKSTSTTKKKEQCELLCIAELSVVKEPSTMSSCQQSKTIDFKRNPDWNGTMILHFLTKLTSMVVCHENKTMAHMHMTCVIVVVAVVVVATVCQCDYSCCSCCDDSCWATDVGCCCCCCCFCC